MERERKTNTRGGEGKGGRGPLHNSLLTTFHIPPSALLLLLLHSTASKQASEKVQFRFSIARLWLSRFSSLFFLYFLLWSVVCVCTATALLSKSSILSIERRSLYDFSPVFSFVGCLFSFSCNPVTPGSNGAVSPYFLFLWRGRFMYSSAGARIYCCCLLGKRDGEERGIDIYNINPI